MADLDLLSSHNIYIYIPLMAVQGHLSHSHKSLMARVDIGIPNTSSMKSAMSESIGLNQPWGTQDIHHNL